MNHSITKSKSTTTSSIRRNILGLCSDSQNEPPWTYPVAEAQETKKTPTLYFSSEVSHDGKHKRAHRQPATAQIKKSGHLHVKCRVQDHQQLR